METASASQPGPDGLTIQLGSNNPFRNRAISPVSSLKPTPPASPFDDPLPPQRPVSRNPFLDPPAKTESNSQQSKPDEFSLFTDNMTTQPVSKSPTAEDLFDSLKLVDDEVPGAKQDTSGAPRRPMQRPPGPGGPPRGGPRGPPPPGYRGAPPNHRPSRSQEEAMRRRMPGGPSRPGPSVSPHKRSDRRPRRNSESSVLDQDKPLTEEEKKARDARRRERERRHREREAKDGDGKPRVKSKKLDLIDQLDATSIFGTGAFHHDGPFDACNPNRNRKGSRRAPMLAFAKDSLNNVIGGSGPLNARPDHSTFLGTRDEEAFRDYSQGMKGPVFDPMSRGHIVHGDESIGLGTSTFLEGTPAARTVIEKTQAEQAAEQQAEGGLQRKKSLAQRFRSINRGSGGQGHRKYSDTPLPPHPSGHERSFSNEFSRDQPESLTVRSPGSDKPQSPTSPPSRPNRLSLGLERRATSDAAIPTTATSPTDEGHVPRQSGSGLLARVKSLKGGRKARRTSDAAMSPPAPAPGTAV